LPRGDRGQRADLGTAKHKRLYFPWELMQSKVVSTAVSSPFSIRLFRTAGAVRYRPLGAFRFGLALLVAAQHFQRLLAPGDRAVFDRMGFGAIAVAVFFAVSGFVVTEANAVFYAGRPWAFLENRMIRLVPPYLAALGLAVAVHWVLWQAGWLSLWDFPHAGPPVTPARVLAGVFGLVPGVHALWPDSFEFIPFAWSLRMEVAFYAAVTLILLAPRRAVGFWLAAAWLASVVFLLQGRPGLLSCAPMFLLGVAVCLVVRGYGWLARVFFVAVLPLSAWGFASWGQHGHPVLAWQFEALAALLLMFAVLAAARSPAWFHAVDRFLGDLSYPLYLNHYAVGLVLTCAAGAGSAAFYGLGLLTSVLLAAAMAALVDGRFAAVRDRVRRARL
jgi:peptidoglycan/LPS O-acetylase OafA/YrhL